MDARTRGVAFRDDNGMRCLQLETFHRVERTRTAPAAQEFLAAVCADELNGVERPVDIRERENNCPLVGASRSVDTNAFSFQVTVGRKRGRVLQYPFRRLASLRLGLGLGLFAFALGL